jgi:hypothetical protein
MWELIVGAEGVTLRFPDGLTSSVGFDTCAAILNWGDGTVTLIDEDGFQIVVRPEDWDAGPDAVSELRSKVPRSVVVDIDQPGPKGPSPSGSPPYSTSGASTVAAPPTTGASSRQVAKGRVPRRFWLLRSALLAIALIGVAVAIDGKDSAWITIGLVAAALAYAGLFYQLRRMRRRLRS